MIMRLKNERPGPKGAVEPVEKKEQGIYNFPRHTYYY
jgi:hypothetical protein